MTDFETTKPGEVARLEKRVAELETALKRITRISRAGVSTLGDATRLSHVAAYAEVALKGEEG